MLGNCEQPPVYPAYLFVLSLSVCVIELASVHRREASSFVPAWNTAVLYLGDKHKALIVDQNGDPDQSGFNSRTGRQKFL